MPYYMGDWYRGDYYPAGDPGFFSALGRLVGHGVSMIPGVGAARAAIGAAMGSIRGKTAAIAAIHGLPVTGGAIVKRAGAAIMRHPVLSAAGAAGVVGAAGAMIRGREGMPQRGFHISKKTGNLVRNRRMRVTNPKALRRAIRRATGFARLARRVLHFTSPRAPRGRAIFRHRRGGTRKLRA